ncbi:MAG TPA: protein kinase, partial [Planctomycetota bacterium]
KPHNLMVAGERVVVTDFGLAKELAVDTSLSLSGSVLGTPAFMPPEQAGGRAREVDARSDVYALGATLYDRLAGRPPFAAADVVALLRAVVEDEPVPLATLAPEVPRDLALVVHKCLEKDKGRRYASAAELADDLERWLEGRPVRAQPPTLGYRLAKTLRRHRGAVAAAVTLALVALGAVLWNWSERAQRAAVEETLALDRILGVHLENARGLQREDEAGRRAELDQAVARAREFLARHPEAYEIEVRLGECLRERGEKEAALAAFERALARRGDYAPALLKRGILRAQLAGEHWAAGERSAELEALRAGGRDDLARLLAGGGILSELDRRLARAELARLSDRPEEARRLYEDVQRIAPHEAPPALAAIALAAGDPDEAFRQAMSAMDLARGFAPAYVAQGSTDTPEEAVRRAIRQHERAAAGDGAGATLTLDGLAGTYTDWAARLAEQKSTAAAYGLRATGELRRAAELELRGKPAEALAALTRAAQDLGHALTITPDLLGALTDRAQVGRERARLLDALGDAPSAAEARARARTDLERAHALAPEDPLVRSLLTEPGG